MFAASTVRDICSYRWILEVRMVTDWPVAYRTQLLRTAVHDDVASVCDTINGSGLLAYGPFTIRSQSGLSQGSVRATVRAQSGLVKTAASVLLY